MHIGTHGGNFHADEVFAVAALSFVFPINNITRSRDPRVLAACDMRIDVGGVYQATTGDFDHHQSRIARPNGVPYSSFGLIWRHYGSQICGSDDVMRKLDRTLVQPIDLHDVGEAKGDAKAGYTVSDVISAFNPTWQDATSVDEAFAEAVKTATNILRNAIRSARACIDAKPIVQQAIARRADPHVLVLPQEVPWQSIVIREASHVRYVVYQGKQDGRWRVEGVPRHLSDMTVILPFPEAWRGKMGDEIAALTGVPDAVFCHLTGYLAAAMSREGAIALAEKSIAHRS